MQSTLGINVSLMGRFFCIEDAKVMGLTPNPDLCLKAITPSGDTKQSISAAASLPLVLLVDSMRHIAKVDPTVVVANHV